MCVVKPGMSPSRLMCRILARSSLEKTGNGSTTWRHDAGAGSSTLASGTDRAVERGDELFADRVERRVGDLGEELAEVVEEQPRLLGERGDRRVGAHRADAARAPALAIGVSRTRSSSSV